MYDEEELFLLRQRAIELYLKKCDAARRELNRRVEKVDAELKELKEKASEPKQ